MNRNNKHRVGYILDIPVHSWPHKDVLEEMGLEH